MSYITPHAPTSAAAAHPLGLTKLPARESETPARLSTSTRSSELVFFDTLSGTVVVMQCDEIDRQTQTLRLPRPYEISDKGLARLTARHTLTPKLGTSPCRAPADFSRAFAGLDRTTPSQYLRLGFCLSVNQQQTFLHVLQH